MPAGVPRTEAHMNIQEAKEQIKNTVRAYLTQDNLGRYLIPPYKQRPVFLMGPPGIGKTAIMEQIASELHIGLLSYSMTHHTRQSALGLPVIKHVEYDGKPYDISEYTMSEIISSIYEMQERTGIRTGILFLDEINCVSETLTPIMLQFLQYKVFGRHTVPPGWIVVTAGNPPEYNNAVREFDIATWDRLKRMDVEPDFAAWKEFAYESGVHASIMTYLSNDENYMNRFYRVKSTVDGKRFVTARGWDDLSQMLYLYEMHNIPVDVKLIGQYIQDPEIASHFSAYYDLYNKYRSDYQIASILEGKAEPEIRRRAKNAKFDERYSLLGLLLEAVMSGMKRCMDDDGHLSSLLVILKGIKQTLLTGSGDAGKLLEQAIARQKDETERSIRARSMTNEQQGAAARLIDALNKLLVEVGMHPEEDGFTVIKRHFDAQVAELHADVQHVSAQVSNMFQFCDDVYPDGRELSILVAELTANPHSARFLAKYRIEEYFIHNKSLMFQERRREILSEIESLDL